MRYLFCQRNQTRAGTKCAPIIGADCSLGLLGVLGVLLYIHNSRVRQFAECICVRELDLLLLRLGHWRFWLMVACICSILCYTWSLVLVDVTSYA